MKENTSTKELTMSGEIKVLKANCKCLSLSGRSTLTYQIGCSADRTIHLCITGNTGAGIYSKDWIGLSQIDDTPITAKKLREIFKGKSVNTVSFLIAALIAEGLLKVSEGSLRSYERVPEYQNILNSYIDADSLPKKTVKKKPEEPSP